MMKKRKHVAIQGRKPLLSIVYEGPKFSVLLTGLVINIIKRATTFLQNLRDSLSEKTKVDTKGWCYEQIKTGKPLEFSKNLASQHTTTFS